jgi:hypothetical protein
MSVTRKVAETEAAADAGKPCRVAGDYDRQQALFWSNTARSCTMGADRDGDPVEVVIQP